MLRKPLSHPLQCRGFSRLRAIWVSRVVIEEDARRCCFVVVVAVVQQLDTCLFWVVVSYQRDAGSGGEQCRSSVALVVALAALTGATFSSNSCRDRPAINRQDSDRFIGITWSHRVKSIPAPGRGLTSPCGVKEAMHTPRWVAQRF